MFFHYQYEENEIFHSNFRFVSTQIPCADGLIKTQNLWLENKFRFRSFPEEFPTKIAKASDDSINQSGNGRKFIFLKITRHFFSVVCMIAREKRIQS